MTYFRQQKEQVQALQTEIDTLVRETDRMVYGLSTEEIAMVENS